MVDIDGRTLDIREQNVAVERVLEMTANPRHRYMLQAYLRHRYLESAGRYEEILTPELTVENPVYHFSLISQGRFTLTGRDQVGMLYKHWTDTDQCVFYVADESVSVGDHLVVGRGISYQQTLGSELAAAGVDADPDAMYLDDSERAYFKLDPADVLAVAQARELLDPLILPLPPFDSTLLPQRLATA